MKGPKVQDEIARDIEDFRLRLVWFAPPCTVWGPWTTLNDCGRPQELRRLRAKEKVLVEFVEERARRQTAAGNLAKEGPMNYCVTDTCAYGLTKKPDGIVFQEAYKDADKPRKDQQVHGSAAACTWRLAKAVARLRTN